MPHPELVGGFDVIEVRRRRENYDMFVGTFKDGQLHLLGYRPADSRAYFGEMECTTLDMGIVSFAKGSVKEISDLRKGNIVLVRKSDGSSGELNRAKYVETR